MLYHRDLGNGDGDMLAEDLRIGVMVGVGAVAIVTRAIVVALRRSRQFLIYKKLVNKEEEDAGRSYLAVGAGALVRIASARHDGYVVSTRREYFSRDFE